MNQEEEITMLEFGKEYECGNYVIEKIAETFSDYHEKRIADTGLTGEVLRIARDKKYVPYMTIRDVSGLFEVKLIFGTVMYNFFDTLELDEENNIKESSKNAAGIIIETMFKVCNLLPDVQCVSEINTSYDKYLERLSERTEENK